MEKNSGTYQGLAVQHLDYQLCIFSVLPVQLNDQPTEMIFHVEGFFHKLGHVQGTKI